MQIPVYDNHNKIISVEEFKPNLNIRGPAYINEGCNMGICRITQGEYKGCLALLYQDMIHPSCNHGELISDNDAWELCKNRGKMHLIQEYNIEWNLGFVEVEL